MLDTLSIAKTGLNAQQMQLDIISNNLANVSTTGFKASRPVFQDLLYQTIRQPGGQSSQQTQLSSGLQLGTGVQSVASERLFTQGTLAQTGNQLDLAVNGQGFFQVLQPDGTTSYSRDGSFQLNAQGQVVTASGFPLQPAITIPPGAQSITIGQDGTVSIVAAGASTTTQIGTIQLANFINPAGLQAKGNNLYAETESSGTPTTSTAGTNGLGLLAQGYTESSNVNVVEELVNMIQTQRTYEMNSKAITTADQMLQNLTTTMT